MKLYEMKKEYEDLYEAIMDADGDATEELMERMANLAEEKQEKYENTACLIKSLVSDAAAIKAEKSVLAERQSSIEAHAERLKVLLSMVMQSAGDDKFETARCRLSFRSSKSVDVTNEALVPEEYKEITIKVKKSDISAAMKNGKEVPGCGWKENQNLQIK